MDKYMRYKICSKESGTHVVDMALSLGNGFLEGHIVLHHQLMLLSLLDQYQKKTMLHRY